MHHDWIVIPLVKAVEISRLEAGHWVRAAAHSGDCCEDRPGSKRGGQGVRPLYLNRTCSMICDLIGAIVLAGTVVLLLAVFDAKKKKGVK